MKVFKPCLSKVTTRFNLNYLGRILSNLFKPLLLITCFHFQNVYAITGHCESSTAKTYQSIHEISIGYGESNYISFSTKSNTPLWQTLSADADSYIGEAQYALLLAAKASGLRINFYCTSTKYVNRIDILD